MDASIDPGTYELREELTLAVPPAHPVEGVAPNANPLATTVQPPTGGVKLSLLAVQPRRRQPQIYSLKSGVASDLRSIKEAEDETVQSPANDSSVFNSNSSVPVFGESNTALASATSSSTTSVSKDGTGLKRRKPKNNIVKSSSSFVSRVVVSELSSKRLSERSPEGLFVFLNVDRALHWLDFSSKAKHDPLSKVLFTKAHALCHDVNDLTKSTSHLDVIMGTSASDVLWYEPMVQKYARINKNGTINNSPISHIKWLPGSENLFMAAHFNGSLVVYDKEKEDAQFVPEEPDPVVGITDGKTNESCRPSPFRVLKSVNSQNQRTNPVAYWKLSNKKINQFALSPDNRHLAVVLEDGSLRIIDYLKEQMLDLFSSYYGGLLCVCWSPDGQYILTGGEDDLVSIWSLAERNIVARCQGHNSWVNYVAFDPWRCDERNYRFGSVGDDCRLLLWDFSVAMLHRPKATSARQRNSIIAASAQPSRHRTDSLSASRVRSDSTATDKLADEQEEMPVRHSVEPRARTAQLPPIMSKVVAEDPITWLGFLEDSIMTASMKGPVRTWDRPHETANELTVSGATNTGPAN